MRTVRLSLLFLATLLLVGVLVTTAVKAQPATDDDTVATTVEIVEVSVTIDYGQNHNTFNDPNITEIAYGTMPFSATRASHTFHEWNETVAAEGFINVRATVGGVKTMLDIRGHDTDDWDLSDTAIGEYQYRHAFGTAVDGDTGPASYGTFLSDTYKELVEEIEDDSMWFGLEMHTPSSGETAQQEAGVTVLATYVE